MSSLTIFTPTFNRAHTLPRLFQSLINQTSHDFEWLIVDDGSTDDTEHLVSTFKTGKFRIRYIKQTNQGKHVATNLGLKRAEGELFTCLDSDDWFHTEAVEYFIEKFKNNSKMNALITLDMYEDGIVVGERLPEIATVNWVDLRYKHAVKGDKCYVFRTSIVRHMTFPQHGDSRHMPPSYQLFEFSKIYECYLANVRTKYVEYLEDGISSKVKINYFKSAENYCQYRKFAHNQLPNFSEKIKNILLYDISWIDTKLDPNFKFKNKISFLASILCLPFSAILYVYYKSRFRKKV